MKEIVDFRITEDRAARVLGPEDGVPLGGVRKLRVPVDDERVQLVVRAQAEARERGEMFASFAQVRRRYTRNELDTADRLWLEITSTFEPEGEACGTIYDHSAACPECGAGAPQRNLLHLDARRLPKKSDIAKSIADEWVVSQRLAELLVDRDLTGFELRPVVHRAGPPEGVDLETVPSGRRLLADAERRGLDPDSWAFIVWLNRPEQRPLSEAAYEEAHRRELQRPARRFAGWYGRAWHRLLDHPRTGRHSPRRAAPNAAADRFPGRPSTDQRVQGQGSTIRARRARPACARERGSSVQGGRGLNRRGGTDESRRPCGMSAPFRATRHSGGCGDGALVSSFGRRKRRWLSA